MAAQCPPSPEQAGRELQHEGDGGLQGPPRQADHGEMVNFLKKEGGGIPNFCVFGNHFLS